MQRVFYFSPKRYPATTADHVYEQELVRGFCKITNTLMVVEDINNDKTFDGMHVYERKFPSLPLRRVHWFFWLPFFLLRNQKKIDIAVVSDRWLAFGLILWKFVFRMDFVIVSIWHLLHKDWLEFFIAYGSNFIFVTSNKLKKNLTSNVRNIESKTHVGYGGVNLDFFKVRTSRESLLLPQNKFLVGYVGGFRTLGEEKGLLTMIMALNQLPSDINMVFVGGSKEEIQDYLDLASGLDVSDRCFFFGRTSTQNVALYEMALDVLVIPYPRKTHFEEYGFPMKIWEYLAAGIPIVYSDLEIMNEVLENRAVSFEPEDPQSLAIKIKEIYNSYSEHQEKSNQNQKDIRKYTWEALAHKIYTVSQNPITPINKKRSGF